MIKKTIHFFICLVFASTVFSQDKTIELPLIGDRLSGAVSETEEQALGRLLLRDLKKDYLIFEEDIEKPEVIIVGDYEDWNFKKLNQAFQYVMSGSRILALHMGKYYRVDSGLRIDAGAFVAALEFATNKKAKIVGKPNKEFFNSALNDMGFGPKEVVMFGDDLINDISGAQELDIPGILVKTGKYHEGMLESSSIIPNGFLESIADLPKIISNGEQL